jgi:hypothetical protein
MRLIQVKARIDRRANTDCVNSMNRRRAMSNKRWLATLGMLVLTAAPMASQADEARRALDACVQSFVETYLPGRVVHLRKAQGTPGPLAHYEDTYTIALAAHGAKSGQLVAQARCVASRRGSVLVLDNPPPENYQANADFTVDLK